MTIWHWLALGLLAGLFVATWIFAGRLDRRP